jgi:hypothetical protein
MPGTRPGMTNYSADRDFVQCPQPQLMKKARPTVGLLQHVNLKGLRGYFAAAALFT